MGGVFVTGEVGASLDGNPYAGDGLDDRFVVNFASDGTWLSSQQSGTPGEDMGLAIATDTHQNLCVAGDVPGVGTDPVDDILLTKMTAAVCPP